MKILIITGGTDREREISFFSSENIVASLVNLGHEVEVFDYKDGDERLRSELKNYDLAFPMMHGKQGEAGELQKKLESWNVEFLGPSSQTCLKAWDKYDFKKFCEKNGILTPKWQLAETIDEIKISMPIVIKATDDGSTVDTFIVKNKKELNSILIKDAFKRKGKMIAEEFIDGIEVTSAIWGEEVLPLVEIRPPEGELFDFENKYNGKSQEIPFAPSLSKERQEKVNAVTEKMRNSLKIRDFSRVDYMVRGNEIFALELNTIPGMSAESLLPKAIKAAGMSMEEALDLLIKSHSK